MRKLAVGLAVTLVAAAVLVTVMLGGAELPAKARFDIDLAALRQAAGPIESGPSQAAAERVAQLNAPECAAVAGGGFKMVAFGMYSWLLTYADGTSLMIDPVHSRKTNEEQSKGEPYDDAAWERQERAIAKANVIVATHEHYDHLGGATDSAHFDTFGPKLKLTAAQRQRPRVAGVGRDLSGPATLESGPEGSTHPVAPGVVAVTTPSHTPGSQLLYVRLSSGRELLFVGDVVWQEASLERERPRARGVSLVMGEDVEALTHQIRAIIDLKRREPSLDIVVAHDQPAMERRFLSGAVTRGF